MYKYIMHVSLGKRTKAFPDKSHPVKKKRQRQKKDKADKSPPVKMTGRTNPSRENNRADKSPLMKMTGRTKAFP
jgi:hypothetical protein